MAENSLLAAVVDGRAENVRFRQKELHQLHTVLKQQKLAICEAISQCASSSKSEADLELSSAMDSIRQSYESLDFNKLIEEEYLVAKGKDHAGRRVGFGLVAIRAQKHSRFYSIIDPLAAAIAAGNCVMLELEKTPSPLDALLSSLLASSLDRETYASTKMLSSSSASVGILVDQTATSTRDTKELASLATARSIAVIDRSADLSRAAKCIVDSRLFRMGTSPYAPDLVIVNEFISEAFTNACCKYARSLDSEKLQLASSSQDDSSERLLKLGEANGQIKVQRAAAGLTLAEVADKTFPLLTSKIQGQIILILPISSLTSTISFTSQPHSHYLISYIFAAPAASKFLSERIPCAVSYINQIPTQLLLGPPSPSSHPHQLHPRYTPVMFSRPSPQIIQPVRYGEGKTRSLKEIENLKPIGQKPGHAVGFFEQGILIGLGFTAMLVLPTLAYGVFRVGRETWRFVGVKKLGY